MPLDSRAETELIAAVRQVAREEIVPRFRSLSTADILEKSRHDDLVTVADRAAEVRLTEASRQIIPNVIVVGEEAVADEPGIRDAIGTAEACIIIDPIDGTWNFANGLSLFAVIIAFAEYGQTTWGMIYDPIGDDWAFARAGEGAAMMRPDGQRTPLRFGTSTRNSIDKMMGFAHAYLFKGEERRRLFEILPDFHKADALRCSAHEYRLLAQGAVDFCLSPVLNPWDHAAGALIAAEAGGVAKLLDGTPYTPTMIDGRLLVARSEADWERVAEALSGL